MELTEASRLLELRQRDKDLLGNSFEPDKLSVDYPQRLFIHSELASHLFSTIDTRFILIPLSFFIFSQPSSRLKTKKQKNHIQKILFKIVISFFFSRRRLHQEEPVAIDCQITKPPFILLKFPWKSVLKLLDSIILSFEFSFLFFPRSSNRSRWTNFLLKNRSKKFWSFFSFFFFSGV